MTLEIRIGPLFAGFTLGLLSAFSPGSVFALALFFLAGWMLRRITAIEDRRFILGLFVVGLLVRMVLSLGLDVGSRFAEGRWPSKYGEVRDYEWDLGIVDNTRRYAQIGDSDYHSERAYAMAQYARGSREPVVLYRIQQYGWHGYAYAIAAFYYLFGFSPISIKFVNCLLGALLGPVFFYLARWSFNRSIGRWAGFCIAFFPSLVLWSATNLKEPSLFLLTGCIPLLFIKCLEALKSPLKTRAAGWLALLAAVLAIHSTLRSKDFSWMLFGSLLLWQGWVFLHRQKDFFRKRKLWTPLIGGFLIIGAAAVWLNLRPVLEFAFARHIGYAWDYGVSYRYLPVEFYDPEWFSRWREMRGLDILEVIGVLSRAVFHFLAEPFPGRIERLHQLMTYPQMILWYFLWPLALIGIFASMRWNHLRTLFLALVLGAWTLMGALTSGNVGTVFRIRDMVSPFFLIFACVGAWVLMHGPARLGRSYDASG